MATTQKHKENVVYFLCSISSAIATGENALEF